jgi:hypothetical protein
MVADFSAPMNLLNLSSHNSKLAADRSKPMDDDLRRIENYG